MAARVKFLTKPVADGHRRAGQNYQDHVYGEAEQLATVHGEVDVTVCGELDGPVRSRRCPFGARVDV
jgi:hypothetical protein